MRDFVVVMIIFGSIPLIIARPYIGILMWFWVSLMNPHRLTYGYAYSLHVGLIIGTVTILAWLFSREKKIPPNTSATYFLAALAIWVSITTMFALVPDSAIPRWDEAMKIFIMTFVAICVMTSKERILQTTWVVTLSIAFFGVKGGLFGIATGGSGRVWGPPESFIEDNNALGLALVMIVPMLHFLSTQVASRWMRLGLLGAQGLNIVAILCTYSRGDFLALAITLVAFWMKAKRRLLSGTIAIGVFAAALSFLPESWYERMYSIENYQTDDSALGRFDAWTFAIRLAADHPITGGGFKVVDSSALFFHYVPNAGGVHAFHSIYFEMLGEHGYVGLAIFLGLVLVSLLTAQSTIKIARGRPDLEWARQLGAAIQISIVGYCAAGAFLNLGIYDLFYALIAILIATKVFVAQAVRGQQKARQLAPTSRPPAILAPG